MLHNEKINYKDLTPKEKIKYQYFEQYINDQFCHYPDFDIAYRISYEEKSCGKICSSCKDIKKVLTYFYNQGYKIEPNTYLESILRYKRLKLQLEYGIFLSFSKEVEKMYIPYHLVEYLNK